MSNVEPQTTNYKPQTINSLAYILLLVILAGCSARKQIGLSARRMVDDTALQNAHVGISIYEPASGRFLYNHQGDKYFVPASNIKIPTCYAALKYLGDSLVGLKIKKHGAWNYLKPTGDPTFLHRDFKTHPVYDFLKSSSKDMYFLYDDHDFDHWGNGWSWNDYNAGYMTERSVFPIYGNQYYFHYRKGALVSIPEYETDDISIIKSSAGPEIKISLSDSNDFNHFYLKRELNSNKINAIESGRKFTSQYVPIRTELFKITSLLKDTLRNSHLLGTLAGISSVWSTDQADSIFQKIHEPKDFVSIYSHPTDSLLKPMMHRSDNFFAEQSLLMVSNELLGVMNDSWIMDTLLKTDFKDLPHKPRWADGSGLSRYNLFTPQDLVFILDKMREEFGMDRLKNIFPTGNEGTLTNYYKTDSSFIYAKTGTLSGVVALSGFLYTKGNRLLVFSVLVNNHQASSSEVRRSVESFLKKVREKN